MADIDSQLSDLREKELALRQKDGKLRKEKVRLVVVMVTTVVMTTQNELREKLGNHKRLQTTIEKRQIQ